MTLIHQKNDMERKNRLIDFEFEMPFGVTDFHPKIMHYV